MKPPAEPLYISSRQNTHFKRWRRLLDPAGLQHFQQFFLFGKKVVRETLAKWPQHCQEILFPDKTASFSFPSSVTPFTLSRDLFRELDCFGTKTALLVCRVPHMPVCDMEDSPQGLEVLCPLGDPANMGALIRCCVAFGVGKLILLQEAVHPCHPRSVRAASGMVFDLPLFHGPSVHAFQKQHLKAVIGLDAMGTNLATFRWPIHSRMLVGEEGPGIPDIPLPSTVSIPMAKEHLSLNATVAAGIAMYTYRLQHPLPTLAVD